MRVALLLGLAVVIAARLASLPQTHWELDEWLFRMGVERFEPLEHHPHPPGYPLLIGLGKLVNLAAGDPFLALVALATVSSILLCPVLVMAFGRMAGSAATGLAGALLFSLSPAMLVHSTTPMSDMPALFFLAIALAAGTALVPASQAQVIGSPAASAGGWRDRRELLAAVVFGAALSASIGCRPQYAAALVPGLIAGCVMTRSWRARAAAALAFTAACAAWLVPLVAAAGGWTSFVEYQATQVATVVAHDALLSRGTRTWLDLGQRFVADAWGPPWLSLPVLALSLAGLYAVLRERRRHALPLLVVAGSYLAFTLVTSDPADAVRYALPIQMGVAFLLALGVARGVGPTPWPDAALAVVVVALAASWWAYVQPVLAPRRSGPSPPVQAAAWARENLGRGTVILPDPALRPHVDLLLPNFPKRMKLNDGISRYWDQPQAPVYMIVEGPTQVDDGRTFAWPASDAYRRLTRNHYRVVSILPLTPTRRYLPLAGVHDWERHPELGGWRWLDAEARLRIPPGEGPLEVALEAPVYVPYSRTKVELYAGEARVLADTVERGEEARLCIDFPREGGVLTVRSAESFVPAEAAGHDPRRLSVQLRDLRRVEPAASGAGDPGACTTGRRAA